MSKGVGREMGHIIKIPGDVMDALRLPPDEAEAELRKELDSSRRDWAFMKYIGKH